MSRPNPKTLDAAWHLIQASGKIAVVMHVNPDGDSIGSALALTLGMRGIGKTAEVICTQRTPEMYDFLAPESVITESATFGKPDLVVLVDCEDAYRAGDLEEFVSNAPSTLVIDHHPSSSDFGDVRLADVSSSSASELVFHLLTHSNCPISLEMASALLTGIITDTGGFRFRNASADTLDAAAELVRIGASTADISEKVYDTRSFASLKLLGRALESMQHSPNGQVVWAKLTARDYTETGALPEDTEGFVNVVHGLKGADVAAILREEEPGRVRVSFRSRGGAPVNQAAEALGGGGHQMAAACLIEGSLDEAEALVLHELKEWFGF